MEEEENSCQALARKYERARRMFGPEYMDIHVMHGNKYEDKITNIETLCDELVDKIELQLSSEGPLSLPTLLHLSTMLEVRTNSGYSNSSEAKVKVDTLVDAICEDVLALGAEVNRVPDWGLVENHEVSKGVRQINDWKNKLKKLVRNYSALGCVVPGIQDEG